MVQSQERERGERRRHCRRVASRLYIVAGVLLAMAAVGHAQEVREMTGGKDHPAVSRFKGAVLVARSENPFERITVGTGPLRGFDRKAGRLAATKEDTVEGRVARLLYIGPPSTTALEVYRNYEQALGRNGFTRLYACGPADCGGGATHALSHLESIPYPKEQLPFGKARFNANQSFYVVARGGTDAAPLWVLVMIGSYERSGSSANGLPAVYQLVIEPRSTSLGNVTVDADAISKALSQSGKVALYGLYFDSDSATLKPESGPQLEQVAAFLSANPRISVLVVGHTDAQGSFDMNLQLSERRAAAIVAALTSRHGIAAARLTPKGVGMLAPVASNRDDAGRARNRRVEIVER